MAAYARYAFPVSWRAKITVCLSLCMSWVSTAVLMVVRKASIRKLERFWSHLYIHAGLCSVSPPSYCLLSVSLSHCLSSSYWCRSSSLAFSKCSRSSWRNCVTYLYKQVRWPVYQLREKKEAVKKFISSFTYRSVGFFCPVTVVELSYMSSCPNLLESSAVTKIKTSS